MSLAEMIALVAVVTEFIKKVFAKFGVSIEGMVARILSWIVAAGVVAYDAIQNGKPFDWSLVVILTQVIIGSNVGYKLVRGS